MPTTNEKIRDALLRYAHYVETLTDRQLRQLEKVLMDSINDINDQITRMGLAGTNLNVWERTRLLTLREEIEKVLAATTSRMSDQIEDNFRQIAFTATDEVNNILRASIPKDLIVMFNAVPLAQVIEFIDAPTGGFLWRDRMIQRYKELLIPMDNIISRGIMQGWSVPQMVKQFKTLVSNEWKKGAWEQIIRTEVVRIGNAVNLATYKQNSDIIKGVQWLATLDEKTCSICAALDGKFWELRTFDLYIPAHPRCRCVLVGITKSWRELGFDVDELPPGTRASMNGQVPSTMNYSEWFGTQSAFFQRNWLGNKRYELWKNGKLEFEDFLDSKKLLKQPK